MEGVCRGSAQIPHRVKESKRGRSRPGVSRETTSREGFARQSLDDTPIAKAAERASRVLTPGASGLLPRPPHRRVITVANQRVVLVRRRRRSIWPAGPRSAWNQGAGRRSRSAGQREYCARHRPPCRNIESVYELHSARRPSPRLPRVSAKRILHPCRWTWPVRR